ncbi:MAG: DUF2513 domain-containing protein [Pseudomonadota bacterium]
MKRDLEVIRKILLQVEASDDDPTTLKDVTIPGVEQLKISHHIEMLSEAGFVDAVDCTTMDGHDWQVSRLTWNGYELLDAIRDEEVWEGTKSKLAKVGGYTLPIVQALASDFIRKQLGL